MTWSIDKTYSFYNNLVGTRDPWNPIQQGINQAVNPYLQGSLQDTPEMALARQQQGAYRDQQMGALAMLQEQAMGRNLVSQQQAALQREAAMKGLSAQAASMSGGFNPAVMRGAQMAQSQASAGIAGQAAMAAAQEKQAALGNYLQGLGAARGQDQGLMQMEMQNQIARQQAAQGWFGMGLEEKWNQQKDYENYVNQKRQERLNLLGQASGMYTSEKDRQQKQDAALIGLAGSGLQAIGSLAGSDKRLKRQFGDADKKIDDFLARIKPQTYRYKDEDKFGEGQRVGPMAQDLEKTPFGKQLVVKDEHGTRYVNAAGASLAALATMYHLNKKIEKLEKGLSHGR